MATQTECTEDKEVGGSNNKINVGLILPLYKKKPVEGVSHRGLVPLKTEFITCQILKGNWVDHSLDARAEIYVSYDKPLAILRENTEENKQADH